MTTTVTTKTAPNLSILFSCQIRRDFGRRQLTTSGGLISRTKNVGNRTARSLACNPEWVEMRQKRLTPLLAVLFGCSMSILVGFPIAAMFLFVGESGQSMTLGRSVSGTLRVPSANGTRSVPDTLLARHLPPGYHRGLGFIGSIIARLLWIVFGLRA